MLDLFITSRVILTDSSGLNGLKPGFISANFEYMTLAPFSCSSVRAALNPVSTTPGLIDMNRIPSCLYIAEYIATAVLTADFDIPYMPVRLNPDAFIVSASPAMEDMTM